jgi:hypothetical protein
MISSLGRRGIKREIEGLNMNDRIVAWIPSYTDCTASGCGFDAVSRAGKDISCTTCNGTGRTQTWASTYLSCRFAWTDVGRPRFVGIVTTEELGDATIETRLVHKYLLEDLRDKEGAYVEADGRNLKIRSVDVNRVEGKTAVVARCEIVRDDG